MLLSQEQIYGEQLVNNEKLFGSLIRTYIEVFNRKGEFEWGENWKLTEVTEYLRKSLSGPRSASVLNLLLDKDNGESPVVGFCVGHIGSCEDVILSQHLPKDLGEIVRKIDSREIIDRLHLLDSRTVLYIQDLGILFEYRSGIKRVTDLILPIVREAVKRHAHVSTYWTSKKSRLYYITLAFNPEEIFRFNDQRNNSFFAIQTIKLLNTLELDERELNRVLSKLK